jgi:hypothetical protein
MVLLMGCVIKIINHELLIECGIEIINYELLIECVNFFLLITDYY